MQSSHDSDTLGYCIDFAHNGGKYYNASKNNKHYLHRTWTRGKQKDHKRVHTGIKRYQ